MSEPAAPVAHKKEDSEGGSNDQDDYGANDDGRDCAATQSGVDRGRTCCRTFCPIGRDQGVVRRHHGVENVVRGVAIGIGNPVIVEFCEAVGDTRFAKRVNIGVGVLESRLAVGGVVLALWVVIVGKTRAYQVFAGLVAGAHKFGVGNFCIDRFVGDLQAERMNVVAVRVNKARIVGIQGKGGRIRQNGPLAIRTTFGSTAAIVYCVRSQNVPCDTHWYGQSICNAHNVPREIHFGVHVGWRQEDKTTDAGETTLSFLHALDIVNIDGAVHPSSR